MRSLLLILFICAFVRPVAACDVALVLAIDVSGSIAPDEYRLQIDGLADALDDPAIVEALVTGQDSLAIVQWSGDRYEELTLPWQNLQTTAQVSDLALVVRGIRRPENYTATAIGQAMRFSLAQFADGPICRREVIDVSGDGKENDGMTLPAARAEAEAQGVTVNGIAIEIGDDTTELTNYYSRFVMTPDGFVLTAKGLQDYSRAIHDKLLRELTKPVA